jgi:hypothetical protein
MTQSSIYIYISIVEKKVTFVKSGESKLGIKQRVGEGEGARER